jgi:hypothetical protein
LAATERHFTLNRTQWDSLLHRYKDPHPIEIKRFPFISLSLEKQEQGRINILPAAGQLLLSPISHITW